MIKDIELLSPAGSMECARAAVSAGADAVYMGGKKFGARAYAASALSEPDELLSAIDYCHMYGVKVYMTVNTLLKDAELPELFSYMEPYARRGVDAVIVQDFGALCFMRENFPDIPIHASTQMTVTGPYFTKLLKKKGVSRIVAARELSLSEIKNIRDKVDIEIEAFVHGALCCAYSGQCLMSSMIGGRSGNRGRCAGPCRLPYDVYDEKMRKLNKDEEKYFLSLKDLNTLPYLARLIDAGVMSMKIEGRMKSPVYVAGVTSVYRKYIDRAKKLLNETGEGEPPLLKIEAEDLAKLREVYDRGGDTAGYLVKHNGRDMTALFEKPKKRIADEEIIMKIKEDFIESEKKLPLSGEFTARLGERMSLKLFYDYRGLKSEVKVLSEACPEPAEKSAATEEEIRKRLSKLGNTDFFLRELKVSCGEGIFIPVKILNDMRREAVDEITRSILAGRRGK